VLLWAAAKKKVNGILAGAVMVLVGAFVMRYDFVVAGQVFPNIVEGLPSYLPTLMECFLILGIFAAFLLVYSLGDRFLPLKEERVG
jgi:molybdopterin-containing oxidoreductase family membrane subunit